MALQKDITLENGAKATYHRISKLELSKSHRNEEEKDMYMLTISVSSYVNSSYRQNDREIKREFFSYEIPENQAFGNLLELAYELLKKEELYVDSIDV